MDCIGGRFQVFTLTRVGENHEAVKIETITGGFIGGGNVADYPWATELAKTDILRISEANLRDKPELCVKAFVDALRRLPAGFYTLVHDSGYVVDLRVGKRGRVRVRPEDGATINTTHQRPCLRIEYTP